MNSLNKVSFAEDPITSKCTYSVFTVPKEEWHYFCRPSSTENIDTIFNEMTEVIKKALSKYENIIIMEKFHIDTKIFNSVKVKLESFCHDFNLTN